MSIAIINAESPRSPSQTGGRSGYRVDSVVWHHTAGGSIAGLLSWFRGNNGTCPHYLVGQDGSIHRLVSEANTAWHAGDWPRNCRSVGIEHQHDTGGPWSAAIEAASKALTADICTRLGIPKSRAHIIGHNQVIGTRCPDNLPIDRWVAELAGAPPVTGPAPPTPGGPYDWQRHNDGQAQTVVLPSECFGRWNGSAGSWWRGQSRVRSVGSGEWCAWRLAHRHGNAWYLLDDQRHDSYGLWCEDSCMDTRPCGGENPVEVARKMGGTVL